MSETELHTGKITKWYFEGNNLQERFQTFIKEENIKESDYDLDDLWIDLDTGFMVIGDYIYKIEDKEHENDGYLSELKPILDNYGAKTGIYEYVCMFYNGGTCLQEMLEDAVEAELKKEKK